MAYTDFAFDDLAGQSKDPRRFPSHEEVSHSLLSVTALVQLTAAVLYKNLHHHRCLELTSKLQEMHVSSMFLSRHCKHGNDHDDGRIGALCGLTTCIGNKAC